MRNLIRRLRSKKGESLLESMVSILIFTLSSIVMITMCSAATSTNKKVRDKSDWMQEHLIAVETAQLPSGVSTPKSGNVKMTISVVDAATGSFVDKVIVDCPVNIYGELNSDSLYTYFKTPS